MKHTCRPCKACKMEDDKMIVYAEIQNEKFQESLNEVYRINKEIRDKLQDIIKTL